MNTVVSKETPEAASKGYDNSYVLFQDPFLNTLRVQKIPVYVYLTNGIKLQGAIDSFDRNVILLAGKDKITQMVYKHAISTIVPTREIKP